MEFQNGKIYTIRSSQTDKYYIGSTNQKTLAQRLGKHRNNYRDYLKDNTQTYVTSYEILQYDDYYIELLELFPCNTKAELHQREGQLQRQFKNETVNKVISGRTAIEWRKDNAEQIATKKKAYNELNVEQVATNHKEYYELNKEQIKIKLKAYNESHKEERKAYDKAHKAQISAQRKAYLESHKEERKEYNKAYKESHKEERKEYKKAYNELHKEQIAIYQKAYGKARYQAKKLVA